jgi:hypothetical protein
MSSDDVVKSASAGFRPLSGTERRLLDALLRPEFSGKEDLIKQLASAEVRRIDDEGSLQFRIRAGSPAAVKRRIPVEAEIEDSDGVPIYLLVHVIDGYLNELEIYRGDTLPIKGAIRPDELRTLVL